MAYCEKNERDAFNIGIAQNRQKIPKLEIKSKNVISIEMEENEKIGLSNSLHSTFINFNRVFKKSTPNNYILDRVIGISIKF